MKITNSSSRTVRFLAGFALALAAITFVQPAARADALIGHWISGAANLTDSSGFTPAGTHDGMAVGTGSLVWANDLPEAGFTGQSLDLTANNVAVLITNSSKLDANYQTTFDVGITNRFSVAFWMKQSGTLGGDFISKSGNLGVGWRARMLSVGGQPAANRYADFTMRLTPAQTDVVAGLGTGNAIEATNIVNDGVWHHVVEVFDGTVAYRKIYVDGVLQREVSSIPYSVTLNGYTNHLMLGANQDNLGSAPTGFFPGRLFDARVYNYPISDGEVQYLFTAGLTSSKDIFNFNFPGLGAATISGTSITLTNVPYTTDITALAPTYLCSALANCSPASGTPRNFTTPQTYTVTAQDSSTKTYTVTVTKAAAPSSACDILSVTWGAYSSLISGTNVSLLVPQGTVVTAINPTVTISPFATVSPASGSTQDFTSPVNYTVTAQDGVTTKTYAVQVVPENLWTNSAGGNWSVAGNWNPNSAPASANTTALAFNTAGTYSSTNDLGDGFQLNLLSFGAPILTLNGNSLQFVGLNPQVLNNSLGSVVVSNNLDLSVDTSFANVGGLSLYGVVSGTGALVKNGAGSLTLSGSANTYSGGTTVNAGFLTLTTTANNIFGTGAVIVNSPAQLNLNGNNNLTNAFTFNGATVANGNSFSANLNGPVNLAATTTIDLAATGNMKIGGNLTGPGGLIKKGTGNGPLVLAGTNSYTGPTTVLAGQLRCTNSVDALGSGALNISAGATVDLGYLGDHSITTLTIAGTTMPNGNYGSATSGADNTNAVFLGTGTLTVGPHNQALIKSFAFPGQTAPAIDQTNLTVSLTVPYATDVTALAPTYTVSPYASCTPASGTALDFTTPQTYTVVSGDLTVTNTYTVTVTKTAPSSVRDILTFGPGAVITGTNINWPVSLAADLTTLAPSYTVSPLASGAPASGTTLDFTTPQTYTVTAEDGSTKTYLVTATPTSGVVFNGSFETPSVGLGNFQSAPSGSGWSFTPFYSGICANGSPWFAPAAPDGVQGAFLQGSQGTITVSQPIDFAAGTYAVTFSVVGRGAGYGSCDLSVQMDGQPVYSLTAAQISTASWTTHTSTNFPVAGGLHTLAFIATNGSGDADVIDNVAITAIAPPVPHPTVSGITGPVAGQFTINGSADVAGNVVVQKTTSLAAPVTWVPIQTNAVPAGAFSIGVPQGSDPSAFYRLMGQ